jgi:hypothetical protein
MTCGTIRVIVLKRRQQFRLPKGIKGSRLEQLTTLGAGAHMFFATSQLGGVTFIGGESFQYSFTKAFCFVGGSLCHNNQFSQVCETSWTFSFKRAMTR